MRVLIAITLLISSIFDDNSLVKFVVQAQECNSRGECDLHERCRIWKDEGECLLSAAYMRRYCPASCSGVEKPRKIAHEECTDVHPRCPVWAKLDECESNPDVMMKYCKASCGGCISNETESDDDDDEVNSEESVTEDCQDMHRSCETWASNGECDTNVKFMKSHCPKSCNTCVDRSEAKKSKPVAEVRQLSPEQKLIDETKAFGEMQTAIGVDKDKTLVVIRNFLAYMESPDITQLDPSLIKNCLNRHELCSFWAAVGECENNKAYMKTNCAPACQSCHLLDMKTRCPLTQENPALKPGSLNKLFERIVENAPGNRTLTDKEKEDLGDMPQYTVHVLSRPSDEPANEVSLKNDQKNPPWMVVFENFVTEEEAEAMIELGYEYVYQRSEDVGSQRFDGTHDSIKSERRTSENAWCSDMKGCRKLEIPQRLHNRIAKVTGIPPENSEDLQLLKYVEGQFYRTHHDFIPHQVERQCGPRVLTFFLYLSDVEEGGGTNFPKLDITVMPKRGRALLWPSVYDADPLKSDPRMSHQALDVINGTKFAANAWLHMYDYLGPQSRGCN